MRWLDSILLAASGGSLLRTINRILQQQRHSSRTHAAKPSCNPRGDLADGFINVRQKFLPFPGDSATDNDSPRLDHRWSHETRHSNGCDQDICPSSVICNVGNPCMHDRDGGVGATLLKGKHERQGTAQRGATTQDHDLLALDGDFVVAQHSKDSRWGAGPRPRFLEHEFAQVRRVQAIGVFLGVHTEKRLVEVETFGDRILNQKGIYLLILIQVTNGLQQVVLSGT